MPLSTKRFVLSDESVNRYGFRVLTSGIDLSQFEKNPVCLYLHARGVDGEHARLPIGHWQDIRVENGVLSAVPYLSDKDEFAMQVFHKIEEGTLRMASAGLDPIETSEDPKVMLPGQTLPTLTRSKLYEASIADMGVNNNALALQHQGKLIRLATSDDAASILQNLAKPVTHQNKHMNTALLTLAIKLGLKENATEADLATAVEGTLAELTTLSAKVKELETKNETLTAQAEASRKAAEAQAIDNMLTLAVSEGRITEAERPSLVELAQANMESVKKLIAARPVHTSAQQRLEQAEGKGDDPLLKMSWQEAHKQGKLEAIKSKFPERYNVIFKEKFGREPQ